MSITTVYIPCWARWVTQDRDGTIKAWGKKPIQSLPGVSRGMIWDPDYLGTPIPHPRIEIGIGNPNDDWKKYIRKLTLKEIRTGKVRIKVRNNN